MSSIRIEAESMTLVGYVVEGNKNFASGRAIVGVSSTDTAGSISTLFAGASGVYDLVVGYYDESDGESQLTLLIDGVAVESWILDQKLGSTNAAASTFVTRQISGVTLNANSVIEIQGTVQKGERARLDFIDITPAGAVEPDSTAPTATIAANNASLAADSTQPYTFTVTYSDNVAINVNSIDNFDVRVSGPSGFNQLATLVSVNNNNNGTPLTATYQILPPGGSWDAVEAGTYTATIEPNQVSDTSGNLVPSGGAVNFSVSVTAQEPPPIGETIRIEAESMTLMGYVVEGNKNFASGRAIVGISSTDTAGSVSTLFAGASGVYDLVVGYYDESDGESQLTLLIDGVAVESWILDQKLGSTNAAASTFVTRQISGVTLNANSVIEIQGTVQKGERARLDFIDITPAGAVEPDSTAPTATITANNASLAANSTQPYTFTVTYSDNVAININSIDNFDVRVSGPSGFNQLATLVSVNNNNNGTPLTATYQILPPGGSWDAVEAGTYTATIEPNQVSDTSGNLVPSGGAVNFTLTVDVDTIAPSATITANNATLTATSTQPYTFTVTYSDNVAIDIGTIDNFDVRVTGPNGFSQLATLVSVNNTGNGSPRTATYQILPPGGSWDAVEAGTYTATIEPNQVSDTSGNLVPSGGAANFSVTVQDLPPASEGATRVEAESMTLTNYRILSGKSFASNNSWIALTSSVGTASTAFTGAAGIYDVFVGYFDQNNGTAQLSVSRNGSQFDSWQLNQNLGKSVAAEESFTLRTIRGVFLNPQDVITIQGIQNSSETAQVDFIEFRIDRTAPTASLIAENSVKGAGSNEILTFNVRYIDDFGIDVTTLGNSNIRVIGPNGFNQPATLVAGNQNFNVFDWRVAYRSATYSIAAPSGGWNLSDSGTYSVVVENNQVTDQSGNFVAGQTIGSFQVNVLPTTFSGTNADEVLEGNALNNTLNGAGGNDTLRGRGGNNLLNGGDGIDTADYSQSTRGVIANLATGQTTSAIFGTLAQPKIMPMGDSITAGEHRTEAVPGAYRIRLWERFQAEGLNIDFVGSQSNGPAELGDKDHEGYPGRTIKALRGIITQNNILETYQPDVITLMIGANDTSSTRLEKIDEMLADLGNLIDTIAVRAPQTQLVVSSITPVTPALRGTYRNQLTQDYNSRIAGLVDSKAAQGRKVSFAEIGRKISFSDMNSEGLHPTAAGYNKLGDAWFDALVQKDTLVSIENLTGSAYDDSLIGNAGVNVLNGGAGNDTLRGGAGNDTLIGGTGNDVFVLASGEGNNWITDFQSGSDRLGLANNLAFSQLTITDGAGADAGNTLIQLTSTSELLATLQGVSANTVGSSAFITV